ncbi:uroporphyrinogen decarboxylase [Taylorella equigenitalis]|uniref:uroporphyrinogen decarboxylase n=1 Tax=Taylorella equigenitalis TaxID=29575 RepID=UPI0023B1D0F0|nr:uroporphyrinogen decarboxylase [Taylorella equigenitalis]WEE00608.1 uroporphyrinogen decarboxylase [Taylorella equigenitalis]WEE02085.1 uroporphyrinogen decarboxylase [Taylorella equigenitalis]WFD78621.1 uroporphyrinogen decarboxylase [Taylorella equigenitalis]WFD80099.1 uroporphyrinogen decarboxylase [Taylorella equigenitalis]WFD81576.1 uroporphyrinogen decarboxylase [Taylorella equigenitalis]
MNDTFLRALLRQKCEYTPIWLMRQAGRYLPEYRATREKAGSFLGLAKSPEFACEVTLQPIDRFNLDAAILFSDILMVPDAMGLGLDFVAGEGPKFANPIRDEEDVKNLKVPDMNELRYVFDAVKLIRGQLQDRVPLIGFAGSPWTIACYMIEGCGSKEYRQMKSMMYSRPELLHSVLEICAQSTAQYLIEQVKAGAQAIMIFDSWGGVLAHGYYQEFSLKYMRSVLDTLRGFLNSNEHKGVTVPVIAFTKGGGLWLEDMVDAGFDALGLDWTVGLSDARRRVQDRVALQGNLDPMALFSDEKSVRAQARNVIDDFGPVASGGHVFNLGHGISQFTNPDIVEALVDEVHNYSKSKHL